MTAPADLSSGEYLVRIRAARKTGRMIEKKDRRQILALVDEYEQSPAHYAAENSKLTATLDANHSKSLKFDLTGDPEKALDAK